MRLGAALACAAAMAAAQAPQFEVQSRLVLVPVVVTERTGRVVDGLEAADFQVLDNGRPQRVSVDTLATGVAPIALVAVVQASGISAAALAKVRKIGAMIQPLVTGERGTAAVATFAGRIHWLQDFTSDGDAIERAFHRLAPSDEKPARMVDAVSEAVARLRERANVRRVVLVISESRDRGSETELENVIVAAQASGVTVYAAPYSAFKTAFTTRPSDVERQAPPEEPQRPGSGVEAPPSHANIPVPPPQDRVDLLGGLDALIRLGKTNTVRALARATGGELFPFTRQSQLEGAIAKLGEEVHSQYVLSFMPENPAPGFHRLEVKLRRAGDFRIRARPGYWR